MVAELDSDNSGKVDASELLKLMDGTGVDLDTIKEFIKEHDKDGDGQLNRQELTEFLNTLCG